MGGSTGGGVRPAWHETEGREVSTSGGVALGAFEPLQPGSPFLPKPTDNSSPSWLQPAWFNPITGIQEAAPKPKTQNTYPEWPSTCTVRIGTGAPYLKDRPTGDATCSHLRLGLRLGLESRYSRWSTHVLPRSLTAVALESGLLQFCTGTGTLGFVISSEA